MIRLNRLPFAVLLTALLIASGCEQTSTPVRREILGSWRSEPSFPVQITMTLAETARSIDGAGGWNENGTAQAFRATGALARDEVSLHFDFDERPDVSFQGVFINADRIDGLLFGGEFAGQEVQFDRVRLRLGD